MVLHLISQETFMVSTNTCDHTLIRASHFILYREPQAHTLQGVK